MGFYGITNPNPNTAQFSYPRRGGVSLSGTCIMHTAESALDVIGDDSGAEDVAAFCMRRTDFGCYHSIVDSNSIVEIYPYEYETWQDSETNNWAVGISAACRTSDWRGMDADTSEGFYRNLATCAADFIIYMRDVYNIAVPLKRISGQEARNRVPGFCAHGDSGISRTDPGADFDWARFFKYTEQVLLGDIEMAGFDPGEGWYNAMIQAQARIDARTHFVKGDKNDTVYDMQEDGNLRSLTYNEWVLWAEAKWPVTTVAQAKIDARLAEIKKANESNPS